MKVKAPGFRVRSSYSVAFSPDGEHLAIVGREVVLWSVSQRKRLRSNSMLKHPSDVAFSPSGQSFCIKNTAGEILTCETASADPVARFIPEFPDEGSGVVYDSESRIVDGSWAGDIRIRSAEDLRPHVVWRAERTMVSSVLRARNGDAWAFAICPKHGHPEFESGADCILVSPSPDPDRLVPLQRQWSQLRGAVLSPSGEQIAVRFGAKEHFVEVVDTRSAKTRAIAAATQGGTNGSMCWSPDGEYLILVERCGFSFRRASNLQEVGWLPCEYPSSVAFSPAAHLIALGDWSNGLVLPWPASLSEFKPRDQPVLGPGAV
jgi:WD40 repeat protein